MFQAVGELSAFAFSIPVPGPFIGMLFLVPYLTVRGGEDTRLTVFSTQFLGHLRLLFIPATVGIILHLDLVVAEWLPILVALTGSTFASIIVTAFTTCRLKHDKE